MASGSNVFVSRIKTGGRGTPIGVQKLSFNGTTWQASDTNIGYVTVNALAASGTKLFAATGNSLLVSSDAGNNWNPDASVATANYVVTSGTNILVATATGVLYSKDAGSTWAPINSGLEGKTITSFAFSNTAIFAIDNTGKVYTQPLP